MPYTPYATEMAETLREVGFRVNLDTSNDSMGKKIRSAKQMKLLYFVAIGDKEVESQTATLDSRDTGALEIMTTDILVAKLISEVNV